MALQLLVPFLLIMTDGVTHSACFQARKVVFKKLATPTDDAGNLSLTFSYGSSVAIEPVYFETVTRLECGMKCAYYALSPVCRSFSFASETSHRFSLGLCEVHFGSRWFVTQNWTRNDPPRQLYVDQSIQEIHSRFKLILPRNGGSADSNQVWNTDCMVQGGISGILVAVRNNLTRSYSLTDLKCRVFEKGISLVRFPGFPRYFNHFVGYDMTCPAGTVITAVYDIEVNLPDPNYVRCNTLVSPWQVDTTNCHHITVLKPIASTLPLSPMNDPTLSGTANSVWGAQCGTADVLEAMVAYKIASGAGLERITCCPLVQSF